MTRKFNYIYFFRKYNNDSNDLLKLIIYEFLLNSQNITVHYPLKLRWSNNNLKKINQPLSSIEETIQCRR